MHGSPGRLWALLFGLLAACGWAPFDPSLMDDRPDDARRDGSGDDRADDATQDGTDEPSDDDTVDGGDEPLPDDSQDDTDDPTGETNELDPVGESEPNDSMRDAQAVGVADVVLAEWTPAGDEDWYVLSLYEGDVVAVRTMADDGSCDFDSVLFVYDEMATPQANVRRCEDEEPPTLCVDDSYEGSPCAGVEIEVSADGLYYVRAIEYGNDEHALYSIEFELLP